MRSVLPVGLGAILMIGAVAGFVIVPEHKPQFTCIGYLIANSCTEGASSGWARTAYDVARIGTWALLIVGALLVMVGLINYARR